MTKNICNILLFLYLQKKRKMSKLKKYFKKYRKNTIGNNETFINPLGKKTKIVYADWTASSRLYKPIEDKLMKKVYPLMANTHTETSFTGAVLTKTYHKALEVIKKHVNAGKDDIIISEGSGMTAVVTKLQRMLGFKIQEHFKDDIKIDKKDRPIIFVSHMEHHSNQVSWLETICDLEIIKPTKEGLFDFDYFEKKIEEYKDRKVKIASVTATSNVSGVHNEIYKISEMIHKAKGLCFVDYACSAPYINIDMHPKNENQKLDAIYFSIHKFLGGPGGTGILVFNKELYTNKVPDKPGGGTVTWTNPWGRHSYFDDIEVREDGGTPEILQTIKSAMAVQLKEEMGVENILKREKELFKLLLGELEGTPKLNILADNIKDRLPIFSFYIDDIHYNLVCRILNDFYGIQARGGCSCAGTYGHYLLNVTKEYSNSITCEIDKGDLTHKPGWIRLSAHPVMDEKEILYIAKAIKEICEGHPEMKNYTYVGGENNDFEYKIKSNEEQKAVDNIL